MKRQRGFKVAKRHLRSERLNPVKNGESADGGDARAPVVLGREMAQALDAEAEHRRAHPDSSTPLEDLTYDRWAGEYDLARFRPCGTDEEIRRRIEHWRGSPTLTAEVRDQLRIDDNYTLFHFVKRAVVCSFRERDHDWALSGLQALPLITGDRIDWRDLATVASMAGWALHHTGQDAHGLLLSIADAADENAATILRRCADHVTKDLRSLSFEVLTTKNGVGFARHSHAAYDPSVDLAAVAVMVAEGLDADRYIADEITVADHLPLVWFRGPLVDSAEAAIGRTRACVFVGTEARPETGAPPWSQLLIIWLAEMASEADAEAVTRAALAASGDHVRLAFHQGSLCCVMVASSTETWTAALESQDSINRFEPMLRSALASVTA